MALRNALVNAEDDYLASSLSVALTKLTIKARKNLSKTFKTMSVDSILIVCALLKAHQVKIAKKAGHANANNEGMPEMKVVVDRDNIQRMQICLRILT